MSTGLGHGNSREPDWWATLSVKCVVCKRPVNQLTGILCGNYCYYRGEFPPCNLGWHADCFKQRSLDKYPVAELKRDDEFVGEDEVEDEGEGSMYKSARLGDNYLCPFQCDLCHFRNVFRRNPEITISRDKVSLNAIR